MPQGRPTVAWMNGTLVPWGQACVPIEDRGLMFGESVYEVLPVSAGRGREMAPHLDRMRDAACALGIERGLPSFEQWGRIAETLVGAESITEGLLYAQLTGGAAPRMHVTPEPARPTFFAYLQAHRFPRAQEAARGIRAVTVADTRWERCDLKTTMLLPAVLAKREAARRGAEEALWLGPSGEVREGSTSNVFLVERGRVISAVAESRVLPGVTRVVLAATLREAGIPILDETVTLDRLHGADEVFVTSTSRLAMPVVAVDDRTIGAGTAGPVSLDMARRLRDRLDLDS